MYGADECDATLSLSGVLYMCLCSVKKCHLLPKLMLKYVKSSVDEDEDVVDVFHLLYFLVFLQV